MSVKQVFNTSAELDYPTVLPTLDLDFANSKTLDPRITFTRASGGSYVGADGLIKYAGVNEARFDHNPYTGESLGLLIEEARTNSIRNSTMVGAVAGTPGTLPTNWAYAVPGSGLARSVIGTGVENGVNYVDIRINGTATSTTAVSIGIDRAAAATGQTWTSSAYLKLSGGSTAGILSWNILIGEADAANAFLAGADYPVPTPSGSLVRSAVTRTLTAAATAFADTAIRIFCTNGAAIDFTLRIGLPQLEQGGFATSVIPTSTATRTRAADDASITGRNFSDFYRQDEGTVYADIVISRWGSVAFPRLVSIHGSNANDANEFSIYTRYVGGVDDYGMFGVISDGVGTGDFNPPAGTTTGSGRVALSGKQNDAVLVVNGLTTPTDNTVNMPTSATQLLLFSAARFQIKTSGYLRRLTYYPKRLPDAQLQSLTR